MKNFAPPSNPGRQTRRGSSTIQLQEHGLFSASPKGNVTASFLWTHVVLQWWYLVINTSLSLLGLWDMSLEELSWHKAKLRRQQLHTFDLSLLLCHINYPLWMEWPKPWGIMPSGVDECILFLHKGRIVTLQIARKTWPMRTYTYKNFVIKHILGNTIIGLMWGSDVVICVGAPSTIKPDVCRQKVTAKTFLFLLTYWIDLEREYWGCF